MLLYLLFHQEWITNIAAANFLPSCGNHIQASAAYIAYNSDVGGGGRGCLGLLPLSARGRQVSNGVTLIHAHPGKSHQTHGTLGHNSAL